MLGWLFVFLTAVALLFALDFVQLLVMLPALWAMHAAASVALFYGWQDAAAAEPGPDLVLVNVLVLSAAGLLVLLLALRRLNRFERLFFVNTYVLSNKVQTQSDQIQGGKCELLAVFSNPRSATEQLPLQPLQLGRELKFLLHSLPPTQLAIEPAARMSDVRDTAVAKRRDFLAVGGLAIGCRVGTGLRHMQHHKCAAEQKGWLTGGALSSCTPAHVQNVVCHIFRRRCNQAKESAAAPLLWPHLHGPPRF